MFEMHIATHYIISQLIDDHASKFKSMVENVVLDEI